MIYDPAIIFSSIFLSFYISLCCFVFAFSWSSSLFFSCSNSCCFSSSLRFFSYMMRCFSYSARTLISSFSRCSRSSISRIFSLSSTRTTFSTSMIYLPSTPCFFMISEGSTPYWIINSCSLSFCTSSWYSLRSASLGSSLMRGLFTMFLAREA